MYVWSFSMLTLKYSWGHLNANTFKSLVKIKTPSLSYWNLIIRNSWAWFWFWLQGPRKRNKHMGSIGTHTHWVSPPEGIKPDQVISLFFILVRHSRCKMHSHTLRRIFNYSLSRQLRSSKNPPPVLPYTVSTISSPDTAPILTHFSSWRQQLRLVTVAHSSTRGLLFNDVPGDAPQETASILPHLLSFHAARYSPASLQSRRNDCLCEKGCCLIIVVSIWGCWSL